MRRQNLYEGWSSQSVSGYSPSQPATKPCSSSFPAAQSGCSIINLLEMQPSTALLSKGLTWLTERAAGSQLAPKGQGPGQGSLARAGPSKHLGLQVLLESMHQKLFPERISTSTLLPESLKAPSQPSLLPNPMKSPPVPTALPGAKREVLRESRAGSRAADTHFILSASVRGSCAQKNRSLRLSPRPLTHPASSPCLPTLQRDLGRAMSEAQTISQKWAPRRWRQSSITRTSLDYSLPCQPEGSRTPSNLYPYPHHFQPPLTILEQVANESWYPCHISQV